VPRWRVRGPLHPEAESSVAFETIAGRGVKFDTSDSIHGNLAVVFRGANFAAWGLSSPNPLVLAPDVNKH